jgi:hypothetical protein
MWPTYKIGKAIVPERNKTCSSDLPSNPSTPNLFSSIRLQRILHSRQPPNVPKKSFNRHDSCFRSAAPPPRRKKDFRPFASNLLFSFFGSCRAPLIFFPLSLGVFRAALHGASRRRGWVHDTRRLMMGVTNGNFEILDFFVFRIRDGGLEFGEGNVWEKTWNVRNVCFSRVMVGGDVLIFFSVSGGGKGWRLRGSVVQQQRCRRI